MDTWSTVHSLSGGEVVWVKGRLALVVDKEVVGEKEGGRDGEESQVRGRREG